jgi:phage gpG-like protein
VKLVVDVQGQARAWAMLNRIARHVEAPQPAADEILKDMRKMVSRQFSTSGSYRGPGWKPLKADTVKAKEHSRDGRVRANARRTLVATGKLRGSLTDARRTAGASSATRDEIVLASRVKYAAYQHRGTGHLPARPLIRVTLPDMQRWERILLRHLTQRA